MNTSEVPEKSGSSLLCHSAGDAPDIASSSSAIWLTGGTAVLDGDGRILSANDALALWLGASRGELQGQSLPAWLGQRCPEWEQPAREFLKRPTAFDHLELAAPAGRGRHRLAVESTCHQQIRFVRMESVVPPAGDLAELFPGQDRGHAAMHAVFNRLLRAEAQLDNLVHRWPGILFSQRPDFSFGFVSPRIEDLTGVPPQEWRRQSDSFWRVVHEADADALRERLKQSAQSPESMTGTFRIRHIQTGRVTYLWEHRQPVRSLSGLLLGYEGIWLEVTRQTIAERRLRAMSWKENLGTLTMGLAHDFCNIMTGIVALSETFEKDSSTNESLRRGLGLIRGTAVQASDLAHRLRQLHQGKPGEKNYHDLNEIVSNLATMLQKVLTRSVQIQSNLEARQLPVYVDAVELRQVIVNLALNAAEAMPNGGSLIFRTSRHAEPPAAKPVQGRFPRAPLVCLSVQDAGVGIPAGHLQSIFDPFFTTKPLEKGSGLGLYNARLFAENHGVAITVETRERVGTTFHLWFAESDFSEAQRIPEPGPPTRHTLLVAAPPGETRDRLVELFRSNGFYVVPAEPEYEALEALSSPDYDLSGVLLIYPQPDTDAPPLWQRIRSTKRDVKTFLSVVGCNQDELPAALFAQVTAVLPPDLQPLELVARIKAALDRP